MYLDGFGPMPSFGHLLLDRMLIQPEVKMGLRFLLGPIIADTRIEIESINPDVQEYVEDMYGRFMARGMETALNCVRRGFCANETLFEKTYKGQFAFKELKHIDYRMANPIVKDGKVIGIEVSPEAVICDEGEKQVPNATKKKVLTGIKKFWTVHQRDMNAIFGRSQLLGSHIPYWELCSTGGIRDVINIWFRKNAYDGGEMYVPDGSSKIDNVMVENRVIAQRILDLKRSGGSLVLPSATDENGNPLWRYNPPSAADAPKTLLDWYRSLKEQIWEGMEVPPELAMGTEAGQSNNKRVIQTAFYTLCTGIATNIIHDFDEQVGQKLVRLNFMKKLPIDQIGYRIKKVTVISEMDYLNQQNQQVGLERKANNNPFNNGELGPDVEKQDDQLEENPPPIGENE